MQRENIISILTDKLLIINITIINFVNLENFIKLKVTKVRNFLGFNSQLLIFHKTFVSMLNFYINRINDCTFCVTRVAARVRRDRYAGKCKNQIHGRTGSTTDKLISVIST